MTMTMGMVLPMWDWRRISQTALGTWVRSSFLESTKTMVPEERNDLKASELVARQGPHVVPGSV
ncbi:MAG: hypothetical protein AAGC74_07300 [Verrucomicrobiota bacterium]